MTGVARAGGAESAPTEPTVYHGSGPLPSWSASALGPDAPFFDTGPNPSATRRILLVFFYFAPSAEVGALRWLSLARFGAERGWAFDVVTLHPRFMGTLDATRLAQLPLGARLFGFSGEEPGWYRGLVSVWRRVSGGNTHRAGGSGMGGHLDGSDLALRLVPSDAPAWRRSFRSHMHVSLSDVLARRAANVGVALARSHRYDMVVSSGPPHAAHLAARTIASQAGIPFVMDMRDPWSDETAMPEELRSNAWRRSTRAHESECVSAAEMVVVTSKAHEELQVRKYPELKGRFHTVMNGADADVLPASRVGQRFVVAFAGTIYLGRNPRALFRAAARVARETGASPDEFGVEFMGDDACDGVPLTTIARDEGLTDHFRSHGFRPRRDALEFLAGAAMLVSLPLRTAMTLPAKLFEYTRFDAWLLILAEPGSATAELLRDTDANVVQPDDDLGIARAIRRRYDEFRAGGRATALNRDGRFDRARQSAHLFGLLDRVATAKQDGRGR